MWKLSRRWLSSCLRVLRTDLILTLLNLSVARASLVVVGRLKVGSALWFFSDCTDEDPSIYQLPS